MLFKIINIQYLIFGGLKVNIGDFSYSYSFGIGESYYSIGWKDSSLDIQIGINKIDVGTTYVVNGMNLIMLNYIMIFSKVIKMNLNREFL